MGGIRRGGIWVGLVGALLAVGGAEASSSKYARGDTVPLYANKVGPFANPSEVYEYYTLPFCAPNKEERKNQHLGEVLGGDRMMMTLIQLPFLVKFDKHTLCSYTLRPEEVLKFQKAVDSDYYFEFIYDDIPIWGFVGEKMEDFVDGKNVTKYYLFTDYVFSITHNGDQVIEATWEPDPETRLDITDATTEKEVHFRYSALWTKSHVQSRAHALAEKHVGEHLEIRWFAIFNSLVTVLMLTGFLATILMRVLKNDFLRYTQHDEESVEIEETGWKLVHADVFRPPSNITFFSAIVGNGTQLLCICIGVLFLACLGVYTHNNRGAMLVAALLIFSLTSGINGYIAGAVYATLKGTNWVSCLLISYFLFLGPFFVISAFLNSVAWANNSSTALPFGTVVIILLILLLVSFPLNVAGSLWGKDNQTLFSSPCRSSKVARAIPPLPWYRSGVINVAAAGLLPFSAIYIELYYVFNSMWGHKLYTLYGILSLVFLILIIVTSFIAIAFTYFQVAAEDHRWWWRSLQTGGSAGIFIFFYGIYYFSYKTKMAGFMQTAFFFGYTGLACLAAWLILATVGWFASMCFVQYIYRNVKCD